MAEFVVEVVKIDSVESIPKADRIEVAYIGGYQSIIGKGQFKAGDLAAYIPCGTIVPYKIIEELNLVGKLGGNQHNRVKEYNLNKFDVFSEGILYPAKPNWVEGQNVVEEMGFLKWEPEIPVEVKKQLSGCVHRESRTVPYDIENYKKFNRALTPGEDVVITEKIHGTWCEVGVFPNGTSLVTSKGLAKQQLALGSKTHPLKRAFFKLLRPILIKLGKAKKYQNYWDDKYSENIYLKIAKEYDLIPKLKSISAYYNKPAYIFGEIFGPIQDLHYGTPSRTRYLAFDIYVGTRGTDGKYLDHDSFVGWCNELGIDQVPVLYIGPFSEEVKDQHTDGLETVSGHQHHIREGIVIKPVKERKQGSLGRVILKSVSKAYLTRKGNTTEFN